MNEKQLIEFLKNNMRIELDENYHFDWDNNPTLTIKIFIKDEKICSNSVQLYR